MKSYSIIKTAEIFGVHKRTIKNWIYAGKIRTILTPTGYHKIQESEINRLLGDNTETKAILYSRVSTSKQKDDLERQHQRLIDFALQNNYEIIHEYKETASGLNDKRKKLLSALDIIKNQEANVLLIEHKDRLTRFGFEYLNKYCESHNATIEVINNEETKDDIVKDLVDIITCFCAKIYGRRSFKTKKKVREHTDVLLKNLS